MIKDQGASIFSININSILILCVCLVLLLFSIYLMLRLFRKPGNEDTFKTYISQLNETIQNLNGGQFQLTGSLESLSKAHTMSVQNMEVRLAEVQRQMSEHLHDNALKSARSLSDLQAQVKETLTGSSEKTNKSLTQLQERLSTIDKAQSNIEKLSGDVLSLQDILSNKQTRGAFGEIQLNDIVKKALPPDSYSFQHTLSNGKRADCLIYLPNPPGPIVIDAKFPLEAYEKLIS